MGREGEKEGEIHQWVSDTLIGCFSHAPTGGLAWSPGMCPDWESNPRPFGSQVGAQFTELYQSELFLISSLCIQCILNTFCFKNVDGIIARGSGVLEVLCKQAFSGTHMGGWGLVVRFILLEIEGCPQVPLQKKSSLISSLSPEQRPRSENSVPRQSLVQCGPHLPSPS